MSAAVTGMGAIHGLGQNLDALWEAVRDGRCPGAAEGRLPCELDHPEQWVPENWLRRMGKDAHLLVAAVRQALAQSGAGLPSESSGLVVSTNLGSLNQVHRFGNVIFSQGLERANPMEFPNTVLNAANGYASIACGLQGYNNTLCGGGALAEACDALALGRAERMIAAGMEEATGMPAWMASRRTPPQAPALRGMWWAEGSAALVLEPLAVAQGRGVPMAAMVTGWGATNDAAGLEAFEAEGLIFSRAIRLALEHAGCRPADIDGVVVATESGPDGDGRAARALQLALGSRFQEIPAYALADGLGNLGGAHEAFGAWCACSILSRQQWPANSWRTLPGSSQPGVFSGQRVLLALTDRFGLNYAYCFSKV